MLKHEKLIITADDGAEISAVAPVIISASRSTDIPGFYSDWFFERLKIGHCAWINIFNRQKSYVSFKNTRAIVFWSKNPAPVLRKLPILDEKGIGYYFQFTLNDYEAENLEPNVPPLQARLDTFRELSRLAGSKRVIWRYDPIILAPGLTPQNIIDKIRRVGNAIKGCTDKLVFSFVDIRAYKKVRNNLIRECSNIDKDNVLSCEPNEEQQREILAGLVELREMWHKENWRLEMASCSETIDLSSYGIFPNRCIDGDLLVHLFSKDRYLLRFLAACARPGSEPHTACQHHLIPLPAGIKDNGRMHNCDSALSKDMGKMKDKGQRQACGCILSKDIGIYDTCAHHCIYCYANDYRKSVGQRAAAVMRQSESGRYGECLISG